MEFPRLIGAATFAAAMVLGAGAASAGVIYSQIITPNTATRSDSLEATYVYDTFSLGSGATVNSVQWQGLYFPTSPGIQDFDIAFYANSGGAVGSLISVFHVGANVHQTPTGQILHKSVPFYSYTADLGAGVSFAPGSYWLDIFDNSASVSNEFFWAVDTSLPETELIFLGGQYFPQYQGYFILSQNGSAVPEPLSLALFGAGLAGAAAMRRRKTRAAS